MSDKRDLVFAVATVAFSTVVVFVAQESIRYVRFRRTRVFRTSTFLDDLSDNDVEDMFRLNCQRILDVYNLTAEDIEPLARGEHAIPGMIKLLAVLNYLGSSNL